MGSHCALFSFFPLGWTQAVRGQMGKDNNFKSQLGQWLQGQLSLHPAQSPFPNLSFFEKQNTLSSPNEHPTPLFSEYGEIK